MIFNYCNINLNIKYYDKYNNINYNIDINHLIIIINIQYSIFNIQYSNHQSNLKYTNILNTTYQQLIIHNQYNIYDILIK